MIGPVRQEKGARFRRAPFFVPDQKIRDRIPITTSKPIRKMMPMVPPMNLNMRIS